MISAFERKMDRINSNQAYRWFKGCYLKYGHPIPTRYTEQMKTDPDFKKKSRKSKKRRN